MRRRGLAASLLLLGCATLQDALESKDDGTAQVYPVTEAQAWEISRKVLRWEGADVIEDDRENQMMLTGTGPSDFLSGTVMVAWIEPLGPQETKVTVVTKRRYKLSIFTSLTEGTYHQRFQQAVALVQAGQPVPLKEPRAAPESPPRPPR
ncbi:MAG: hypothetical protein ACYTEZ_10995 [Planctomycetota bacterium]|jgi:hypothetical protein